MQIISGVLEKPVKGLIYGPQGVGKSSLAKDMPNPIFIDVEGGTTRLNVKRTPRPMNWAHLMQIVRDLASDLQGFQTIVFDTSDWMERLAVAHILGINGSTEMGKDASGKKDWGKSYTQLTELWSSFLTQIESDFIDSRKAHVVFLAHSTTKRFELPEENGEFDKYMLKMSERAGGLVKEWCELMLFVNYQTMVIVKESEKKGKAQGGARRMMYADNRASFEAKNRFSLPPEMELGFGPIARCFQGGIAAAPAPVVPNAPMAVATPAAAPIAAPTPAPEPAPATGSPAHAALTQMMTDAGVTYDEVLAVLMARGHYPAGTPFENIAPEFINGWITKFWPNVLDFIKANKTAAA